MISRETSVMGEKRGTGLSGLSGLSGFFSYPLLPTNDQIDQIDEIVPDRPDKQMRPQFLRPDDTLVHIH